MIACLQINQMRTVFSDELLESAAQNYRKVGGVNDPLSSANIDEKSQVYCDPKAKNIVVEKIIESSFLIYKHQVLSSLLTFSISVHLPLCYRCF